MLEALDFMRVSRTFEQSSFTDSGYILAEQLFLQSFHNEHRSPLALAEDNCLSPSYSLNSNEFQFTDTYTRSAYCLYDKANTIP